MNAPESDDMHWSAYRYATGEMTDDESAVFELCLANDQLLREALEQTVELLGAARIVYREQADKPRFSVRRTVAWAASLAACAVLSFAAYRLLSDPAAQPPDEQAVQLVNPSPALSPSVSISLAWAEVRNRPSTSDVAVEPVDWNGELAPEWPPSVEAAGDEDAQGAIPGWLLAAVEADNDLKKELP